MLCYYLDESGDFLSKEQTVRKLADLPLVELLVEPQGLGRHLAIRLKGLVSLGEDQGLWRNSTGIHGKINKRSIAEDLCVYMHYLQRHLRVPVPACWLLGVYLQGQVKI